MQEFFFLYFGNSISDDLQRYMNRFYLDIHNSFQIQLIKKDENKINIIKRNAV